MPSRLLRSLGAAASCSRRCPAPKRQRPRSGPVQKQAPLRAVQPGPKVFRSSESLLLPRSCTLELICFPDLCPNFCGPVWHLSACLANLGLDCGLRSLDEPLYVLRLIAIRRCCSGGPGFQVSSSGPQRRPQAGGIRSDLGASPRSCQMFADR